MSSSSRKTASGASANDGRQKEQTVIDLLDDDSSDDDEAYESTTPRRFARRPSTPSFLMDNKNKRAAVTPPCIESGGDVANKRVKVTPDTMEQNKPAARKAPAEEDQGVARLPRESDQDSSLIQDMKELEARNASLQKELDATKQQLLREGGELVAVKSLLEEKKKELAEANALLHVERKEHAKAKHQLEAELAAERHELGETTNKLAIARIALSKTSRDLTKEHKAKEKAQGQVARLEKRVTELSKCISGASALMNNVGASDEQEGEDDEEEEDNIGTEEEEEEDEDNESAASTAGNSKDTDGLNETWKGHFERLKLFKETHGGRVYPTGKEDKSLSSWLSTQRKRRKKMLDRRLARQSSPSEVMTQTEFDKLKELGVDPDLYRYDRIQLVQDRKVQAARDQWNAQYEKLVQFKKNHGHVSVPKEHKKLASWVKTQQTRRRMMLDSPYAAKNSYRVMEEDEYEKLKNLGVQFDA